MESEPEITTMGEKGQVVIPKNLRKHLGVEPRTRFMVFGSGDLIVLKRLALPDIRDEWDAIFAAVDRKGRRLTEKMVEAEIAAVRRARKRRASG
ncbi:MAG TPA: AbrB/MazE/SpoVT family DNA-binding domain-containing protein [Candidatus Thermoplasmatota archaeon]|nr:AbrB/MazE/SpoVT family DNA-binding domain-containing protein [Candidatus Thermoplasmatota archaeon]